MRKPHLTAALVSLVVFGVMPIAAPAADLSRYRDFQFGTDLATVAKQAGVEPSEAKVIQSRPALMQELSWRPQTLGQSPRTDPQVVVFSFYNNELFRIVVTYDRYETEGLTTADMVAAFSVAYGTAAKPAGQAEVAPAVYNDEEEILARWQDAQYRFELIRSSFGPSFRLTGVLKKLEAPVHAAALEAKRLDDREAPQKDAARVASEEEASRVKLEKARLVNKPKFRP